MRLERLAAASFALGLACSPMLVPDWPHRHLDDPAYWGVLGFASLAISIPAIRLWRGQGSVHERLLFGAVLGAMPIVYLFSAWRRGAGALGEGAGAVVFAAMAIAGAWRAPRLLVLGLTAHGVLWDAWHIRANAVVPSWYGWACLYADIALAIYAYAQLPAWTPRKGTPRSGP